MTCVFVLILILVIFGMAFVDVVFFLEWLFLTSLMDQSILTSWAHPYHLVDGFSPYFEVVFFRRDKP